MEHSLYINIHGVRDIIVSTKGKGVNMNETKEIVIAVIASVIAHYIITAIDSRLAQKPTDKK
jgi:hypothetical protein|nr:MAG TPA: hypothetical protein [Caudoviricetes sp.]